MNRLSLDLSQKLSQKLLPERSPKPSAKHFPNLRTMLLAALLAMLLLSPPLASTAQEAPATPALDISVAFDPPAAALGERTRLTIAVRHGNELLISVSAPRRVTGLEVLNASPAAIQPAGDDVVTTVSYLMAGFTLGELQPGDLRVHWLRADGSAGSVAVAAPLLLVQSTLQPDDTELSPLKPQASIAGGPPPWQPTAAAGAGIGTLALLGGGAWLIIARRRRPAPEPPPPATAEDTARRLLDSLTAESLLRDRDFDAYYGTISVVIRGYLQHRFDFRAAAMTTGELRSRMTSHGVGRWQARLVSGLLDRCDAAVYAGRYPDPASADHDLTVAYEVVELSGRAPAETSEEPATARP